MLVSVIIPTFNRPAFLSEALKSVANQTIKDRIEVIVVNDAGDPVDDVVDKFDGDVRMRLINQEKNSGPSQSRNAALDIAEGEYVAFLDDDDVYAPNHLESTVPLLRAGADFVYVNTPVARNRVTGSTTSSAEAWVHFDFPNDRGLLEVGNHIPPVALVCRSPRSVGAYFDNSLQGLEDWDMWWRLIREFGYRVHHHPVETVVIHRVPGIQSATMDAAVHLKSLDFFEDQWIRVTRRWEATSPRTASVREYMPRLYRLGRTLLKQGTPLDYHYYEHALRIFYDALADDSLFAESIDERLLMALHGRS